MRGQPFQRLAHGGAGDAELFGQFLFRGQALVDDQAAFDDGIANRLGDANRQFTFGSKRQFLHSFPDFNCQTLNV